jgi:protein-disulfide isomerase
MKLTSITREKLEYLFFSLMLLTAAVFAVTAFVNYNRNRQEIVNALRPQIIPVSATIIIGQRPDFNGNTKSSYTLVEWGDYQCGPCRLENKKIPNLLAKYPGKLRFIFRNLPLVAIHEYAMDAAIAAEAAREQGDFWGAHDYLYRVQLNPRSISDLPLLQHLNCQRFRLASRTTALLAVRSDMDEATRLRLNQTPTFALCCPDGRVLELKTLDQVTSILGS